MTDTTNQHLDATGRSRGRRARIAIGAVTLALVASMTAMAIASSSTSINSASNSKLGEKVLVNSKGHTLYVLSPETTHHLLCSSAECLKFWPPLTASSKSKVKLGSGVHGTVGIFHRSNGISQVTLNGHPLYTFVKDTKGGEANGQNFEGFGGTWHVVSTSGNPSSKAASASAPSMSSSSTSSSSSSGSSSSGSYGY